jgi:hypothetical protein
MLIPTICANCAHLFLRGGPPRTAPGASPAPHQKPHPPNGGHSQDHNPVNGTKVSKNATLF